MPELVSNNMNVLSLWFELYSSSSLMSDNESGSSASGYVFGTLTLRLNLELEMPMSLYSRNDLTTAITTLVRCLRCVVLISMKRIGPVHFICVNMLVL